MPNNVSPSTTANPTSSFNNNVELNENSSIDNRINNTTIVGHQTPVLFSSDNGICLRVISNPSTVTTTNVASNLTYSGNSSSLSSNLNGNTYRVQLCDLERWQQIASKVNTIGLSPDAPLNWNVTKKNMIRRHKSVRFVAEAERPPPQPPTISK